MRKLPWILWLDMLSGLKGSEKTAGGPCNYHILWLDMFSGLE